MIPRDIISRLNRAHMAAVRAARQFDAATNGTRTQRSLEQRWDNAEDRFDRAVAAVIEAGAKNARKK